MVHFTTLYCFTQILRGSEVGVDFVVTQTLVLFIYQLCITKKAHVKKERSVSVSKQVDCAFSSAQRRGHQAHNRRMGYCAEKRGLKGQQRTPVHSVRSLNTGLNSDQLLSRALFQACVRFSLGSGFLCINKHVCKQICMVWLQGREDWIHAPSKPLKEVGGWSTPVLLCGSFFYPSLPPIFSLILVQSYRFLACGLACPVTHLSTLQAFFRRAPTGNRLRKSFCFLRMKRYIVETFIKRTLPIQRTRASVSSIPPRHLTTGSARKVLNTTSGAQFVAQRLVKLII